MNNILNSLAVSNWNENIYRHFIAPKAVYMKTDLRVGASATKNQCGKLQNLSWRRKAVICSYESVTL